jgi:hypothetical protein
VNKAKRKNVLSDSERRKSLVYHKSQTTMTEREIEDQDYNKIREETDENGVTVSYGCDYLLSGGNTFPTAVIPVFYELTFPCGIPAEEAKQHVSTKLLTETANSWNILPNGEACTVPQSVHNSWLVAVSSNPGSSIVSDMECSKLSLVEGECCEIVQAEMTFTPQGGYDAQDFITFLAKLLDSGELTTDIPIRTAFIGSEVEPSPPDNLDTEREGDGTDAAAGTKQQQQQQNNDRSFTAIGGLVLAALIAAFLGVVLVMVRRRYRKKRDVQQAVHRSDTMDAEKAFTASGDSGDDVGTFEVHVLSDEMDKVRRSFENNLDDTTKDITKSFRTCSFETPTDNDSSGYRPKSYAFDLGQSMKNDVMGTYGNQTVKGNAGSYGPTTIEVVPPYPMMEETSDSEPPSEADSWAQTDGTVGSLEERLEEITAEI